MGLYLVLWAKSKEIKDDRLEIITDGNQTSQLHDHRGEEKSTADDEE